MTIKRLLIGTFASATLLLAMPGPASAAICVNGANASVLGDADQDNDCETDLGVEAPTAPTP